MPVNIRGIPTPTILGFTGTYILFCISFYEPIKIILYYITIENVHRAFI